MYNRRRISTALTIALLLGAVPVCALEEPPKGSTTDMTTEAAPKHTNRLIDATSPYLLQHAHNPVDWYEWGEAAFAKAVQEDKPIFLSIGYSACHWCHVMEHESFENESVAAILNEHFVCVKVDREERPDVDEIYMQVTVAMTGHGGWPMSLILTPEKVPFFAGTYFPRKQFIDLLNQITGHWSGDRSQIDQQTGKIQDYLAKWSKGPEPSNDVPAQSVVDRAGSMFARAFDKQRGGMSGGGTNKFPPSMAMELMLRVHARTGDAQLLSLVELTLDEMARGGIYDHLGGGICRYSTDVEWLVPHFEKMLYDQALVSAIYLAGYQAAGNKSYADTARGIFDYVLDDLQSPEGGFYSTRDADSEGMEGAYYIWTVEQINEVLGQGDGELFCAYYDVTPRGNWFESRGHAPAGPKNILRVKVNLPDFAARRNLDAADLDKRLAAMRTKLVEVRAKRVPPGLDDKVLTGWNGLMIASLAKGARVLDEPRYAQAAAKSAEFVLANMRKDGRLLRSYRGGRARLTGYLSDYAFFIEGLLDLYEATFDAKWLDTAAELADLAKSHYYDDAAGGFYFIADDAEELLARTKNPNDGAIPSGNSVHALNLLRLSILRGEKSYAEQAESIFRAFKPLAERQPMGFERLLCAVDFYHGKPKEVAIVGPVESAGVEELLRTVYARYVPNKVVTFCTGPDDPRASAIPLLTGKKPIDGRPAAYVCESYVCKKPVTSPAELEPLLRVAPASAP